MSARRSHALELFAPLGPAYDRVGAVLSFGQDPRWRRFLVSRLPGTAATCSTSQPEPAWSPRDCSRGLHRHGARPVARDAPTARARLGSRVALVTGSAEALPFADAAFDHLTFTYLLRYVDDPGATLRELARVVRPGGTVAMLEFAVPRGVWRPLWDLYCDVGLPLGGRAVSREWREVGRFLGPSIRGFHARYPEPRLLGLWRDAGIGDLHLRRMSLGGGVVVWGTRA